MNILLRVFGLTLTLIFIGINATVIPLENSQGNVKVTFAKPGEMEEMFEIDPNMLKLTPIVYEHEDKDTLDSSAISPRYLHVYMIGERTFDDRVVYSASDSYNWNIPMDVRLYASYPEDGNNGAIVTFLHIWVSQSSLIGNAYISSGGIGQRYINFYIEANYTTHFDFYISVYGRD